MAINPKKNVYSIGQNNMKLKKVTTCQNNAFRKPTLDRARTYSLD